MLYRCWEFVGQKEHRTGYLDEKGNFIKEYPCCNTVVRDPFSLEKCGSYVLLPNCGGGYMAEVFYRNSTIHPDALPELISKQGVHKNEV